MYEPNLQDFIAGCQLSIVLSDVNKPSRFGSRRPVMANFDTSSNTTSNSIGSTSIKASVSLNQHIACVPTSEAHQADVQAGYVLPFSVGRIVCIKELGVSVKWMYAEFIDTTWRIWEERACIGGKQRHQSRRADDIEWDSILRDTAGFISINFCADKRLTKASIAKLKGHPALSMTPERWNAFFRKPV